MGGKPAGETARCFDNTSKALIPPLRNRLKSDRSGETAAAPVWWPAKVALLVRASFPLESHAATLEHRSVNRIVDRFAQLKAHGKKGFIVYIGAGDPSLAATCELALAFDRGGVDVLELGVPFSDPLADGLVNQLAAQRGLESGTTPPGVLEAVRKVREKAQIPIVLYLYYNLVHRYGLKAFIADAAGAGVDGLLVLDLPPEESDNYETLMRDAGLCVIYLVAPTTPEERMEYIVRRGSGFVYYVSREGVTGMQQKVSETIAQMTRKIRLHTSLPIAVGFGISNAEQARMVAECADAIVVGSAVVNQIAKWGARPELVSEVSKFARELASAVKPGAAHA